MMKKTMEKIFKTTKKLRTTSSSPKKEISIGIQENSENSQVEKSEVQVENSQVEKSQVETSEDKKSEDPKKSQVEKKQVEKKNSQVEKAPKVPKKEKKELTSSTGLGFGVDKYELMNDLMASQGVEQPEEVEEKPEREKKQRTSARDRKLLKKGIDPATVPSKEKSTDSQVEKVPNVPKQKNPPAKKLSKAQKAKLEKYADQDEDERRIKMEMLGHKVKEEVVEKEPETQAPAKRCYFCGEEGHLSFYCPKKKESPNYDPKSDENPEERELSKQKRKEKQEKTKEEEEELRILMEEENITQGGEAEKLGELDSLTGKPLGDDVLLFAVPVCGPYAAMSSYKFKVKMTPGNLKKGKAAGQALAVFSRSQNSTQQEKDLIKAVQEAEMIQQILGNCKLSTPGLNKIQAQQKKTKKANAKAKKSAE
eukprot:TRINITY_DN726_c0_g1_i2.p2 TRINITY_DN726_c0_g1~~TRINITY_DN726_c0_g1_i2.p2  ORF type:complete len:423 (+),score=243.24 TRINITY_DN726_c0_g1_i2:1165-2433(+)